MLNNDLNPETYKIQWDSLIANVEFFMTFKKKDKRWVVSTHKKVLISFRFPLYYMCIVLC